MARAKTKSSAKEIVRWESGASPQRAPDELAREEPLEIRVDNQSVSVTMRTPGNDDELAVGFLLGEGLIRRRDEVINIRVHPRNPDRNILGVYLSPDAKADLSGLTRHFFASSSCGLCGKASIEAVQRNFTPIKSKITVSAELLLQLPDRLRGEQQTFARTGGLHAAGLFDLTGKLLVAREDVGRHNAVDKVLGWAFLNGLFPLARHILLVSGRVSFEIVQKALAGRVPVIAAVSAPTDLAVEFAEASGQTLVGFVRPPRLNVYTHPRRVKFR